MSGYRIEDKDLLSRMSHDMRTPMNVILGLAELSENEENPDVLRKNMTRIKETGQYLQSLINDTLDFQLVESGKFVLEPSIVPIGRLLDSVKAIVAPAMKKKMIDFCIDIGDIDVKNNIFIDQERGKQVLTVLLSNAGKFTYVGGTVALDIKVLDKQTPYAKCCIAVADTGIGMSEDYIQNHIFKPYSQENNEVTATYAGSGLGLFLVKKIVEQMGGNITVESELGVGTKFVIQLDVMCISQDEAKRKSDVSTNHMMQVVNRLRGKYILLAEDHPLNAEITTRMLENVGCNVTWMKDGLHCKECFEKSEERQFDLILMDIRMPIMNGLDATRAIRQLAREDAREIPIIALTANAYQEDIEQSILAGMDGHLAKPIIPAILLETIAKHIK